MARKEDRPIPFPKAAYGVAGHIHRKEAHFLYTAPARLGAGTYLEIGTFCGRSALCTASGIKDSGVDAHLITVDAYDLEGPVRKDREDDTPETIKRSTYRRPGRFEQVKETFKDRGFADYVTIVRGYSVPTSEVYKDIEFNFLFIDADHSYAGCKADFEAWSPLIRSGGEIAFHDTQLPSIERVVVESGWEVINHIYTTKVIKKP